MLKLLYDFRQNRFNQLFHAEEQYYFKKVISKALWVLWLFSDKIEMQQQETSAVLLDGTVNNQFCI
jgi:hypothetical protein